jgi:hypothetical protein
LAGQIERESHPALPAFTGKSGADHVHVNVWRESNLPVVERTPPLVTAGAKMQYLHAEEREKNER